MDDSLYHKLKAWASTDPPANVKVHRLPGDEHEKRSASSGQAPQGLQENVPSHVVWGEVEHSEETSDKSGSTGSTLRPRKRNQGLVSRARPPLGQQQHHIEFQAHSDQGSSSADAPVHVSSDRPSSEKSRSGTYPPGYPQGGLNAVEENGRRVNDRPHVESKNHMVWASPSNTNSEESCSRVNSEEVLKKVPLDENGLPLSIGSLAHSEGNCKPCLFVCTKVGCQNGMECEFCHFPHKRKNKPRPCKGKRDRYRKLVGRMEQLILSNPRVLEESPEDLPPSIKDNPVLRNKLMSKVQARLEAGRQGHAIDSEDDDLDGDDDHEGHDNEAVAQPGQPAASSYQPPPRPRRGARNIESL